MHYSTMVITENLPSQEDLDKILDLYYEGNYYWDEDNPSQIQKPIIPMFTWDWYQIGGRYNGRLKLGMNYRDKEYGWDYYSKDPRNGRLFYSYLLSQLRDKTDEEMCFSAMGSEEGYIRVDSAKINDIINLNDVSCYYCIDTVNHNVAMQEYWDGNNWIKNEQFIERLQEIKDTSIKGYVTILDLHD